MEHIVQFGVTIDDNAIADRISQQVANQVKSDIKKILEKSFSHLLKKLKDIL